MTVNLTRRARLALYVANVLGTPVVVYLRAKGIIGDFELTLWGTEVTAVMALAGLNVSASPDRVQALADAVTARDRLASKRGSGNASRRFQ